MINITGPVLIIILTQSTLIILLIFILFKQLRQKKSDKIVDEKYKELELKVEGLELKSLEHTLNPHLFKNALNAIQSHAYQTYYALDKLANVLDYVLYESNHRLVSIKEEIDFALNLIEINRLKLSPLFDLRIKQSINEKDPNYQKQIVAPLITVDLIENAFKHADLQREDAFISIVFELRDKEFLFTVSNKISNKPALKKKYGGIGKMNYRKRLEIIYKEDFKLDQFIEGDVYIAHLKINLRERQTESEMLTIRR